MSSEFLCSLFQTNFETSLVSSVVSEQFEALKYKTENLQPINIQDDLLKILLKTTLETSEDVVTALLFFCLKTDFFEKDSDYTFLNYLLESFSMYISEEYNKGWLENVLAKQPK
jgi:hypothetical protein